MFGKIKVFLTAVSFLTVISINVGCFQKNSETDNSADILKSATIQKESLAKNNEEANGNLSCSPSKLNATDILTIKMKSPHGGYLEIITPDDRHIFLSEADGDDLVKDAQNAGAKPFYSATEFVELGELKINVEEAATVDYEKDKQNGKHQLAKIFSAKGTYKIKLSEDSFETDDPVITGECQVYFAEKKESAKTIDKSKVIDKSNVTVKFAKGTSSAIFEGSLKGSDTRDYILNARQGQQLVVNLKAKTEYKTLFTIFEANTKNALAVEDDSYDGKLNENGNYILRVFTYSKEDNLTEKDVSKYELKISVE